MKEDYQKALKMSNLFFLSNPDPFNGQSYKKQVVRNNLRDKNFDQPLKQWLRGRKRGEDENAKT